MKSPEVAACPIGHPGRPAGLSRAAGRPRRAIRAAVATAAGVLACAAQAQVAGTMASAAQAGEAEPADTLRWRAGARVEHDTNVLRAPAAVSDEVLVLSSGVRLDKRYSLQRLTLDAEAARHRFRDLSALDYRTLNYRAAWEFQVTPRLQGTASAQRRQYRDITDAAMATARAARRTERDDLLEAAWLPGGGWRALAGVERSSSASDDPRSLESSPRVRSVRAGLGYEFASGALATLQWRRGDGEYRSGQAPDFRETEPFATLRWPAGGRTAFQAQAGRLSRRHEAGGERDFRGAVGTASVTWTYSPRTRVEAGLARELGSYEFAGGGHVRGWRWHLEPSWQSSGKTTLRLRLAREARDWRTVSPAAPDAGREDRTRWAALTLEWLPARPLALTASVRGERRDASLGAHDFRATIYALGARVEF